MKITYLLNQRFPTEKAYGIQIAEMCAAFSVAGSRVELIAPFRTSKESEDPFSYYRVEPTFAFTRIAAPDWYLPGFLDQITFWFKNIISARKLAKEAFIRHSDVIYSREELPLLFLPQRISSTLVFEIHRFSAKRTFFYRILDRRGVLFVAISHGLKADLVASGISADQIAVAPDGVDLSKFNISLDRGAVREKLGLPLDKKIIMYAGHLYLHKGADVLAQAAKNLPSDYLVVFVGGTDEELLLFKGRWGSIPNIHISGRRSHAQIPLWLHAADVLVLPNISDTDSQNRYTSPLKLFEYMASRRPIVASNLPVLKEVLNDDEAIFFEPGNSQDLTNALKSALDDQMQSKPEKAFQKVQTYSWENRAKNITSFIHGAHL